LNEKKGCTMSMRGGLKGQPSSVYYFYQSISKEFVLSANLIVI